MAKKRQRRNKPGCTYVEQMAYEVEWYRKHGKYPDRIQTDHLGHDYVECDLHWNRKNKFRRESVRLQLADHVAFRVTGIKP